MPSEERPALPVRDQRTPPSSWSLDETIRSSDLDPPQSPAQG